MSAEAVVHVVSKVDNSRQCPVVVPCDPTRCPLPQSSIRVRTALIALTANNLSYARGGTFLHWWDTYPVPSCAPAPFNDADAYGVVPAWGYAVVLESTTSIEPGKLVWGYWPTSTLPTDLKITPTTPAGHWLETSGHRRRLMPLYQRYIEHDPTVSLKSVVPPDLEAMAWTAVFRPVWEGAYLLNRYVFAPTGNAPIHPLGDGQSWGDVDSDLTSAVVVNLSASTKTARSFAWHLAHARQAGTGPLGTLAVTSSTSTALSDQSPFPTKTIDYASVTHPDALAWTAALQPGRIVIVDFGGRGNALEQLLDGMRTLPSAPQITIIGVGSEAKVFAEEELRSLMELGPRLGKIQLNTSGLREAAIGKEGVEVYFSGMLKEWDVWLGAGGAQDMQIVCGEGIRGEKGVEGGWRQLCEGRVETNTGMVFRL